MVADCSHVVHVEEFVAQRFDDEVEIRDGERCTRDLKDVIAQGRDFLLNVEVRALHDGHHRDERGHAHNESEQRQYGPQLVCAQGIETLREVVAEGEHLFTLNPLPLLADTQRADGAGCEL